MISKRSAALFGAFGALLPELLRFSALVANQKISEPPSGWQIYFLVISLYALAAGVLSIAWKPDSEYKAIWVGASFPAIVHTLAATAATHS